MNSVIVEASNPQTVVDRFISRLVVRSCFKAIDRTLQPQKRQHVHRLDKYVTINCRMPRRSPEYRWSIDYTEPNPFVQFAPLKCHIIRTLDRFSQYTQGTGEALHIPYTYRLRIQVPPGS